MAYSMALNAIYNQYLTTYAPKKSDTRYDTHKKSELRGITNSMKKLNKDAPLYKLNITPETNEYIVGIKEETRLLQNAIAASIGDAEHAKLDGKIAYSTDENIATAKYVGEDKAEGYLPGEDTEEGSVVSKDSSVPSYNIEVQSLATAQVNMGTFLPKDSRDIEPGDYSFDMTVGGLGYEFQYSIRPEDTNFDVQNRLSRLINNANIHLVSSVEEDGEGNSSLRIESTQVGIRAGERSKIFDISDNPNNPGSGSVDYLGINYVAREATNAHFTVDGIEAEASSNSFVLEKNYEITLTGVSPEEGRGTTIGLKPDTEAAVENISNLVGGFNQFMTAVGRYNESQAGSRALSREIKGIVGLYQEQMRNIGISVGESGTMDIDKEKLSDAILDGEQNSNASRALKQFSNAMMRKARQVSLNPVSYLDKTVVEYKNPGKTFSSPYVASAYAGMMFNSYC